MNVGGILIACILQISSSNLQHNYYAVREHHAAPLGPPIRHMITRRVNEVSLSPRRKRSPLQHSDTGNSFWETAKRSSFNLPVKLPRPVSTTRKHCDYAGTRVQFPPKWFISRQQGIVGASASAFPTSITVRHSSTVRYGWVFVSSLGIGMSGHTGGYIGHGSFSCFDHGERIFISVLKRQAGMPTNLDSPVFGELHTLVSDSQYKKIREDTRNCVHSCRSAFWTFLTLRTLISVSQRPDITKA